jgi:hypothetical protein
MFADAVLVLRSTSPQPYVVQSRIKPHARFSGRSRSAVRSEGAGDARLAGVGTAEGAVDTSGVCAGHVLAPGLSMPLS